MGSHWAIQREAAEVVAKRKAPRNPVNEPAPWITKEMLVGVNQDGKVSGYESGGDHQGTFYKEFEGITQYADEPFIRVVIYGSETYDIETRIPRAYLAALVAGAPAAEQPTGKPDSGEKT